MTEFSKLPYHVRLIIERCRQGQILCVSNRVKETGEPETLAFYEPSGRSCGPKSAAKATQSGFLKPRQDGLLGDDFSQTWEAA